MSSGKSIFTCAQGRGLSAPYRAAYLLDPPKPVCAVVSTFLYFDDLRPGGLVNLHFEASKLGALHAYRGGRLVAARESDLVIGRRLNLLQRAHEAPVGRLMTPEGDDHAVRFGWPVVLHHAPVSSG